VKARRAAALLRLSGRRFADPENPTPVGVAITQDDLAGAAFNPSSAAKNRLDKRWGVPSA
jgi:hypothetical protein